MPKQCPRGLLWLYGAGTPSAALAHAFTRHQQGWQTLATGALTQRSTGASGGRLARPGLPKRVRDPLLILEKAGAFEHQLKTIGKLTDG